MQSHFTTLRLSWLRSMCLTNPCQSDIWWLTTARRNSYQPILVRIYGNCANLEAWLPFEACVASFHDVLNMYPQNVTVRLKFSVQDICPLFSEKPKEFRGGLSSLNFFFFLEKSFFASCYNTGVVIIKPVTGRASICLASLKTTRRLIALGFHTEEEVCQYSHSQFWFTQYTQYTAMYCSMQYIDMSK